MTDYTGAPCLDLHPEEFADQGTPSAWAACRTCPLKAQCRADAIEEGARGVYRGGQVFGEVSHRSREVSDWGAWKAMRDAGMSLPEIGKAVGRHHTTVLNALRRMEAEAS